MWYQPAWPRMEAFALPSFSEGYVRLNVRGRERDGIVDPADFGRTADEVEAEPRGIDVAPTILALMDVPIPSYIDGKPLIERVAHR
jgi:predicted AlkP superfamily phosphohydrolase/phosphomutase